MTDAAQGTIIARPIGIAGRWGPLTGTYVGNHGGEFGFVDGDLFLREDADGNNAQLACTDGIPPAAGAQVSAPDALLLGLDPACGVSNPQAAYVHDLGRIRASAMARWRPTTRSATGTARAPRSRSGMSLRPTIAPPGRRRPACSPMAADGFFSSVESVQTPHICRMYLSTKDAAGNDVMVSTSTGGGCDALFADGFFGCGD